MTPTAQRQRPGTAVLVALLVSLLGIGGAFAYFAINKKPAKTTPTSSTGFFGNKLPDALTKQPAPRIRLTDAHGKTVDTARLQGAPYLVTFLFTACPDVCPLIGHEIRTALTQLGGAAKGVNVLVVSVDPKTDTPLAARRWLRRGRQPANVYYLLGTKTELERVWNGYYVQPQTSGRPQASTHTASIWLVDKKGYRRTSFSAGGPVKPQELAHDLRVLLREPAGSNAVESKTRARLRANDRAPRFAQAPRSTGDVVK